MNTLLWFISLIMLVTGVIIDISTLILEIKRNHIGHGTSGMLFVPFIFYIFSGITGKSIFFENEIKYLFLFHVVVILIVFIDRKVFKQSNKNIRKL